MAQADHNIQLKSGAEIRLDSEGYLIDLADWTPEVAESLAIADGLELTPKHWEIINLLRAFYQEFEESPAMRPLVKAVKMQLGAEKGSSIYLMRLFPESPPKVAARLAGLPKPTNCL